MSFAPILICNHLHPVSDGPAPYLIVHQGRVHEPRPALVGLIGSFVDDAHGGYMAAGVGADGRRGYINAFGKWLVPPVLDDARRPTAGGLGRFCKDGLWGFCDLQGRTVIEARYEEADAFYYGLAAVKTGEYWYYIDASGARAFEAALRRAGPFSSAGLAAASTAHAGKMGCIDREGKWVIEPRFRYIGNFGTHPVAPASMDASSEGLIDTRGQWVREPEDKMSIRPFNGDGLAYFSRGCFDKSGYLDTAGQEVITEKQRLSDYMQHGLALEEESTYVGVNGELQTSHRIDWGGPFTGEGFTVARAAIDAVPRVYRWGILTADGSFRPAPDGALEPVTSAEHWIAWPQAGTALIAFCTEDGNVVLLDRRAEIAYRLEREVAGGHETAVLRDAQGCELWRSAAHAKLTRIAPFFEAPAKTFYEGLQDCAQVSELVAPLLAETERRLHALAQGEPAAVADTVDDEDEDGGDGIRTSRRVFRSYLGEDVWAAYFYLSEVRGAMSRATLKAIVENLEAAFGPGDPDPDYGGREADAGTFAWSFPLVVPLPGPVGGRAPSRQLWLGVQETVECGDGDIWHEVWLHCAPSEETLEAAMAAAPVPLQDVDDGMHEDAAEPEQKYPETYAEWMTAVQEFPGAIAHMPAEMLDDALVEAALASDVENFAHLPTAHQSPARLESLVRMGAETAAKIPCATMTQEALALARSLYAGDRTWAWADQERSELPRKPYDLNSLHDVWGCLLDEKLAFRCVRDGVSLRHIPRWLRSERVERAAVEKDIGNIEYMDPARINTAVAQAAACEEYSDYMKYIPASRRTPIVWMLYVMACADRLAKVPEDLKTLELCCAAVKEDREALAHVPAALQQQVRELAQCGQDDETPAEPDDPAGLDDEALLREVAEGRIGLWRIPRWRVTASMVDAAVSLEPGEVRYVPRRLMNSALYRTAIEQRAKEAKQVPSEMWNEQLALAVVARGGYRLGEVPEAWRTLAVCQQAIADSSSAQEKVPQHLRVQLGL